jgi:DNA-binding CsgD family transcriptional regulator/tetratricopeptide (TPR) repeat protein
MLGRTSALAALQLLFDRGQQGHGQTILISGEAGIGKTRLVREAVHASAQSFLVLQGHCFQHGRAWPYAPLIELLRGYIESVPAPELAVDAPILEVVRLLPELQPRSPALEPAPALDPEQEKRRLFSALVTLLLELAAQQPLLLIVEDLHWCDEGSLDFLLFLARRAMDTSLLMLLTYRDDEGHPGLPWLAELDRARLAYEIRLSRLSRADVHAMLRAIFALQRPVRREFLDSIYTLTEGNPFFVEEVLSTLVTAGAIDSQGTAWDRKPLRDFRIPRSVQGVVQQRVERLGGDTRRLLAIAAVAGRSFDARLLQEITGLDEIILLSGLKELVDARLVIEGAPDRFSFRHALTRQSIYGSLLARERKALHRLCAESLARAPETDAILTDLAYHFNAAELWTDALEYSQRAARRALVHYAPRAAVEHLDHALHAAESLSVPPTPLLRMRAQALDMLGDFALACIDLERVLADARAEGNRRTEWEALLDLGQLWASRDYGQAGIYWQDALDLARMLQSLPMRAHSLNRIGNWYLNREQPDTARRCHSEALAIFEGLEDRPGLAETLDLLGMANYLGSDLAAGTAQYERAATLYHALDDRVGLINCLATLPMRGGTYQTNTMVAAATLLVSHAEGEEALGMARAIGWRAGEAYALIFLGFCLGSRGDYARALDVLPRALTIAQEIEHRQWTTAACCALGALYLDLLALSHARSELERAVALARETGSVHWLSCTAGFLAVVYLQQQEPKLAEELLASVLSSDAPAQTLGQRLVWCARGELALARDNPQEALEVVDRLEMAVRNGPAAHGPVPALRLLSLRADALAAIGRLEESEALLREALDLAVTQGARPMLWRLHAALGKVFRLQERHGETESACATARGVVESLAAAIPDEALRDVFLRGAITRLPPTRTRTKRRVTRHPVAPLTARECEIAVEVARGKTNAAIASTLVLSERTVESHIGNIRSKLGLTSRTAIASWAAEAGIVRDQE